MTAVITIWYGLVLARTRFGAYTLSIGDSREAVVRAGINDRRHLFKIYLLAGSWPGWPGSWSWRGSARAHRTRGPPTT